MKIRLLHDNVLVRLEDDATHGYDPDRTDCPIVTPEAMRYHSCRGVVVAVGPGRRRQLPGRLREVMDPVELRKGDRVEIAPNVGQMMTIEGTEHRVCSERELQVVL